MFASPSLLLLLAATALADSSSSDPYSKFVSDANSILAAATGTDAAQLDALYSWQATQTAVPSADLDAQYQDYLNAYVTAPSAPLPSWVTAIPTSLQPAMKSFLQAEATLVRQDIAPMVSQLDEEVSAYSATAQTSSSNATVVATSTPTVTSPQTLPHGGADRPAGMAGLAAVVAVLGMIVLL